MAVNDGRIAALLPRGEGRADTEIDATGLVVTPGGIDTHTHIRWPHDGVFTADDFARATRAAALGGTTTILDFVPPGEGSLLERCHDRRDEAAGEAVIDFGFHPILTSDGPSVLAELGQVIADGFVSFKMYTTYEDRRVDDGAAWYLMEAIASHGGLPGFHAENHELIQHTLERQELTKATTLRHFPASRPALAEAESISMVGLYAQRLGTPVYIFHVSGSDALDAVRRANAGGARVFAETCTHYLLFDDSVFDAADSWRYVISPPLRTVADRDDLWSALRDGTVQTVGSDHCAYLVDAKRSDIDDHRHIPAGAPGIEARTPMLFSESVRRFGLVEYAQQTATRAAAILGLPNKGSIEPGKDADLVIWDAAATWSGRDAVQASPESFSLYDGQTGLGRPRDVFVRGRRIVEDGAFVGPKGHGRFLRRPARSRVGEPARPVPTP
ncbi:amidohydrolase family protein [Microbacterium sp. NPDC003461]